MSGIVRIAYQGNRIGIMVDGGVWTVIFWLGSGLIDHSQKMTVAASAMAEKKTVGHRS